MKSILTKIVSNVFSKERLIVKLLIIFLLFAHNSLAKTDNKIVVYDHTGRAVSVDQTVKRIITLAPHATENVYSAGAGDNIVGTVEYSDYPKSARKIERIGRANAYSLEAIVALKPDLVIAWRSGNGDKVIDQLEKLGIKIYISEPHTLSDIAKSIRDIGQLAGTSTEANAAATAFTKTWQALHDRNAEKTTVKTMYQIWDSPLQTLNGEHIISDVIALCGGYNVFAGADTLAPRISFESVLQHNPEVIISGQSDMSDKRWQEPWQRFMSLSAVKENHLYTVHPDVISRHTVRILQGAKQICTHLDTVRQQKKG